jgi:hypothetical protein
MMMRLLATVLGIFIATALLALPADAQNAPQTVPQKKRPAAKPPVTPVAAQPAVPVPSPLQTAQIEQKCLRALNGACTNPISVESARLRAEIIPAVRVSYFGTPAGTIGGSYIPFERLFQDNPLLFGLPTFTLQLPCCVVRSK